MKNTILFDAMGEIDESLIEETAKVLEGQRSAPRAKYKLIAIAACLTALLVALSSILIFMMNTPDPNTVGDPVDTTQGTEKPPKLPTINRVQITDFDNPIQFGDVSGTLPNSSVQTSIAIRGLAVTAIPLHISKDTYHFYDSQTPFHLVLMKTKKLLRGAEIPDYFYLYVYRDDMADFLQYDELIISTIYQIGNEGTVLYNESTKCLEILDYCLVRSYGLRIAAFTDGVFDESLWTSNEWWSKDTEYLRELINSGQVDPSTGVFKGCTTSDAEKNLMEHADDYKDLTVSSLYDPNTSEQSRESVEYIRNVENGLFINSNLYYRNHLTYVFGNSRLRSYTRYINGFPTNETVEIGMDRATYSNVRFDDSDLENMPDLESAMVEINGGVDDGSIRPIHILSDTLANAQKIENGIFGWYVKLEDGRIYGIVRLSWSVRPERGSDMYDDAYYIVEQGADTCETIERDDLMKLLGVEAIKGAYYTGHIFTGGYDEEGMIMMIICF